MSHKRVLEMPAKAKVHAGLSDNEGRHQMRPQASREHQQLGEEFRDCQKKRCRDSYENRSRGL